MRQLYWEWNVPLSDRRRMRTLVMERLWLTPEYAEHSERVMQLCELLPPPRGCAPRSPERGTRRGAHKRVCRGRVPGLLSTSLPLLAQEGP
eukprot:5282408-Pyramimonas_sp.AAC.2